MPTPKASSRTVLRRPAKARASVCRRLASSNGTRGATTQETSAEDVIFVEESQDGRAKEDEIVHRRPAASDTVSSNSLSRNRVSRDPVAERRLSFSQRQHRKQSGCPAGQGRGLRPVPKQSAFPAGRGYRRGKVPVELAQSDPDVRGSEEPEAPPRSPRHHRAGDWRKEGRLAYSAADDDAMRRFVAAHPNLKPKGQQLWKDAEAAGITGHGWASMQNRWRRKLATTSRTRNQERVPESVNKRKQPDIRQALQVVTTHAKQPSRQTDSPSATSQTAPVSEARAETRASPNFDLARDRREVASATADRPDGFEGRWFCGDQAHVVKGSAVILNGTEGVCELWRLGSNQCQFVLTMNETSRLSGKLSADGQQIIWEDGCIWTRTQCSPQVGQAKARVRDLTTSIGERTPVLASLPELYGRQKVGWHCDGSIRTWNPRRQRPAVVNEVNTRVPPGIFYEGLDPSKISGVDKWKDNVWDEIAENVGKHFDEPRICSHWMNFAERFNSQAGIDEPWGSTTT